MVWGEWMSVAALEALIAERREEFVPNCLRAWVDTNERGFVARYLK